MMKIENLLNEEIKSELAELGKMELGSEAYKTTVDGLTKLVDRAIELEKITVDIQTRDEDRETEKELKLKEIGEERKDRWLRHGLTAGGLVVTTALTVWGTRKSIEFEKEGTITTFAGRAFFNKLFPKK